MKVFLSHSWRDKTTADRLAADLQSVADIWHDVRELVPGESIQGSIDAALEQMDIVLVLWSQNSADPASGVHPEIETAVRLGVDIIPCRLDDTPLTRVLGDRLAINFVDYSLGFTRLNVLLLKHFAGEIGIGDEEVLKTITDHNGAVNYVQNYRNRQGIRGDDAGHWINRVLTSLDAANRQGSEFMAKLQRAGDFSKYFMEELEARKGDRAGLRELLVEVNDNEDLEPAARSSMVRLLQMDIEAVPAVGLQQEEMPPSVNHTDPGGFVNDPLRQHIASVRGQPHAAEALRQRLSQIPIVSGPAQIAQFEQALNGAIDWIPQIIEQVSVAGQQAGIDHLLVPILQQISHYFLAEEDLIPDHQGTLGLLDDAYLAHAYLHQLNAAYQANTGFPLLALNPSATLEVLRVVLGPQITNQLDQVVMQGVGQAVQQSQYGQLIQQQHTLGPTGRPGSWGGTWEDEMSRVGAELGISIDW